MVNTLLEHIREYTTILDQQAIKRILVEAPMQDLLDAWDSLTEDEAHLVFKLLEIDQKTEVIDNLSINEQESLIRALTSENSKALFEEMEPDDLVDIMQEVSQEVRESVWNSLSDEAKQETQFLLRFDEDDAAGIMTPRYVEVRSSITVRQTLQFVRQSARNVETVYYIYVVDQVKRLQGVVSLRDLLSADDEDIIEDIMTENVIFVREETDQEEAAKTLEVNDFIALPVLDHYNRLLGIITFDDVIDVIREEQTEDIYKMGAMEGGTERYVKTSVWGLVRKRVPWLIILLLAGTLTTNVISIFEPLTLSATFLILFLPVITQTGGNCGTQSSTLMIRGLATGEIHFRDIGRVLIKEFLVALSMGILLGAVILVRSIFLPPGLEFFQAVAVGLSLVFVVLFSSLIGILAPLIIHRLGFDPTVMAGPLMATVIDVCGITIFFVTAQLLLNL